MNRTPNRSYRWLFWSLAVLGLLLDQGSKYGVFYALYNAESRRGETFSLIPNAFRLTADYTSRPIPDNWLKPLRSVSADRMPHVNHGALFGIGAGNNFFFTLVSLGAAIVIVLWVVKSKAGLDCFLCISLGLILAGTMGNLYDRVVFDGVRDFLHWYYLIDWPVFNIADCCLVCGAGLLLAQALFFHPAVEEPAVGEEEMEDVREQEVVDVK